MHPSCKFRQYRHHGADFSFAGAREHCYDSLLRQIVLPDEVLEALAHGSGIVNSINKRITFIYKRNSLGFEIWDFEREDYEQLVDKLFQFPYPAFPGRPYLWSNVVEHLKALFVSEFCNLEVKTRVVNQYYNVWFPSQYIFLAERHISQQLPGLDENFDESDYRSVFVVTNKSIVI